MEIEQLQADVDQIFSQYPWATEETAQKMAALATTNAVKTTALALAMKQLLGTTSADGLKSSIKQTASDLKKSTAATKARISRAKGYVERIGKVGGGMSGLDAITELTAAGAEALSAGANGLAGMTSKMPGVNLALKGTAWLTGGVAATAGIAAVFSKLVSQQEKELRTMIDVGLVLSDSDSYTTLRGNAVDLGMNLTDYSALMNGTSELLTGVGETMAAGQGRLYNFLTNPETVKRVKNFGYTPKELSMVLADEAKQLYNLNLINELNDVDQKKVVDSFEINNKVAMFLANQMGGRRQELMDARKLIRENKTFQQAMMQNQDHYADTYGENAQANVERFADLFAMLSGPILGEQLGGEMVHVLARTVSNISYDVTPINDMQRDTIRVLNKLGPGVMQHIVDLFEDGVTGKFDANDPATTIKRIGDIVKLITDAPSLQGIDPESMLIEGIRASATLIEKTVFAKPVEEVREYMDNLQVGIDGADDSIEIVGEMGRMFLQVQDTITPGFAEVGTVMKIMGDSVDGFASVWSSVFGLDNGVNPDNAGLENVAQDFRKNAMLTTLLPSTAVLDSNGKIDTTTALSFDKDSNREAVAEAVSRTMLINKQLIDGFRALQKEQIDAQYQIKKLGVDDLAETEEDLRKALEKAKATGVLADISTAEANYKIAIRNHTVAKNKEIALRAELNQIQTALGVNQQQRTANEASIGATHKSNNSYADGSTIEGIMIAELIAQGITDVNAQANVLGMIYGESGFRATSETSYKNTNNQRIRDVFGGRISTGNPGDPGYMTDAQLTLLKSNDKAFFDHVYKDIGGHKYRGRGFIQLTGRSNYKEVGELIGVDLLNNPDLMLEPEIAARASAAYFNIETKKRYKSGLNNTATAYQATYGVAASAQNNRLGDLRNRENYAKQYKASIESGEIKSATSTEAAVAILNNRIASIKADEAQNRFHPGGENQANLRELAELEATLAAEMLKLKELEEARNG